VIGWVSFCSGLMCKKGAVTTSTHDNMRIYKDRDILIKYSHYIRLYLVFIFLL